MSSNRKLSGGRGINTYLEDPFQQSGRIGSEKIVQNGLRFGLTFEEYSNFPGLNQTSLKQYLHHQDRSSFFKINQHALIRGNAGHCLILETDRFHQTYVPAPQGLRFRGDLGKSAGRPSKINIPGKRCCHEISGIS